MELSPNDKGERREATATEQTNKPGAPTAASPSLHRLVRNLEISRLPPGAHTRKQANPWLLTGNGGNRQTLGSPLPPLPVKPQLDSPYISAPYFCPMFLPTRCSISCSGPTLGKPKRPGSFLALGGPYRARDVGCDPFRGRCRPATNRSRP